jgi:hypothetical protein
MLRIVQALNTVLNAESIYLLILSIVDVAIKDSVLNLRKDFLTLMDSDYKSIKGLTTRIHILNFFPFHTYASPVLHAVFID